MFQKNIWNRFKEKFSVNFELKNHPFLLDFGPNKKFPLKKSKTITLTHSLISMIRFNLKKQSIDFEMS